MTATIYLADGSSQPFIDALPTGWVKLVISINGVDVRTIKKGRAITHGPRSIQCWS